MKFITVLTLLGCVVATLASVKSQASGLSWDDAFAPGSALPQICLSMSCVDPNLCFIAGGSNGVGFGIYSYDGQLNGNVVEMNMNNQSMMMMSVEAGGTSAAPRGAAGGMAAIFTPGMEAEHYYDAATKTWIPSATPLELVIASPFISASKDGNTVVVADGASTNQLLVSSDAAVTYTAATVAGFPSPNYGNCSAPVALEVVDANTWYIIFGQEPETASSSSSGQSSSSFSSTGRRSVRRHNREITLDVTSGEPRVSTKRVAPVIGETGVKSGETCVGYSYQILKTTNGGQSFTALFEQSNASFSFSDIACLDANNCVAVGGNAFDSFVYQTKDGQTWNLVYTARSSGNTSVGFNQVAYANASDIWVGGLIADDAAQTAAGMFFYTRDGGRTWFQYTHLQYAVAEIITLTFPTATVGFAAGITQEQSSSILKYAPQPYYGYFAQKQCISNTCTAICEEAYFPQGLCMEATGGSIIATCTSAGLLVHSYETTSCVGAYNTSTAPVNTCLQSSNGGPLGYFENLCNVEAIRKEESQVSKVSSKVMLN